MKLNKKLVAIGFALSSGLTGLGLPSVALAKDWPSGYSKCADEGESCAVGTRARRVSFGIKDKWVTQTLSGTVTCSTATFGSDPYLGKTKKCAIGPSVVTVSAAGVSTMSTTAAASATTDASTETAPATGWASQGGGTTGGSAAAATSIYTVGSAPQLLAALKAAGTQPRIVKVSGTIDLAAADNGGPFKSASDQAARSAIILPSNTTLIGAGSDAGFVNGQIVLKGVSNVIVRNLRIVNPCDIAPQWDPNDGASGNWNSQYDGIVIDAASRVWVDHNLFTDAPVTDDLLPIEHGKRKQCHDGAIDVKNGADYITVSNNVFELHDKNDLIGSSDSTTSDDGHLTVTFHNNYFHNVTQRAPRVRFGKVHLYNNYYEGGRQRGIFLYEYSIGVGYKAKIISANNVFDIEGATSCGDVVKNPGSSSKPGAIYDAGSLLNGAALGLGSAKCPFSSAVGWQPPYTASLLPATAVRDAVKQNAGVGKLQVR